MPKTSRDRRIEVIVRGIARHGEHVLVCRSRRGYSYLPGGHVEFGESFSNALTREFREETGLKTRVLSVIAAGEHRFTQRGKPRHEINIVCHVALKHGKPDAAAPPPVSSREDDISFEWVPIKRIAATDFRPKFMARWIAEGLSSGPVAWIGPRR